MACLSFTGGIITLTYVKAGAVLDAYLDIETTGLCRYTGDVTVVGVYLCDGCGNESVVQLVGHDITALNLRGLLAETRSIYTYNGKRFDLPFLHNYVGLDLAALYHHHDLMYDCWKYRLYGGFKVVESRLGIFRELQGIDGLQAVGLWWRYVQDGDLDALDLLLRYNREDVVNLKALREKLMLLGCDAIR